MAIAQACSEQIIKLPRPKKKFWAHPPEAAKQLHQKPTKPANCKQETPPNATRNHKIRLKSEQENTKFTHEKTKKQLFGHDRGLTEKIQPKTKKGCAETHHTDRAILGQCSPGSPRQFACSRYHFATICQFLPCIPAAPVVWFVYDTIIRTRIINSDSGMAQRLACWAHNPRVHGSRPCSTSFSSPFLMPEM